MLFGFAFTRGCIQIIVGIPVLIGILWLLFNTSIGQMIILISIISIFLLLLRDGIKNSENKTIPPSTNEVPNEDFENALRDWNKNRRRGTQRKD